MRLTVREQRRLNAIERAAYDRLSFARPGAAERARCKMILGWRRTRAETCALAVELLAELGSRLLVAERLGVDPRYLDRVLDGNRAEGSRTGENVSEKASVSSGFVGPTRRPKVIGRVYASDPYSYDLAAALAGRGGAA